jgi:hypothetical protein
VLSKFPDRLINLLLLGIYFERNGKVEFLQNGSHSGSVVDRVLQWTGAVGAVADDQGDALLRSGIYDVRQSQGQQHKVKDKTGGFPFHGRFLE